jgi:mycothiol synthase
VRPPISQPERLDDATRNAVLRLYADIEARDGAPPLSDQALTRLSSPHVTHLTIGPPTDPTGYAQLAGTTLEIAGDSTSAPPLLDAALERRPDVVVWSHGTRSPLGAILQSRHFDQVRVLHQLRRPLDAALPDLEIPDGVKVRDFVVGQDEDAWVRVNAAAFASHPEQGAWTAADLRAREAEAWFDASGFLVAERDGAMIGFHWTKVHGDGLGEVYVLGIDPAAQGLKLGGALLVQGLRRLADRGCPAALLYVDDDNTAAMRLYERLGFEHYDTDIQWRRAVPTVGSGANGEGADEPVQLFVT